MTALGSLVAGVLSGSWRSVTAPPALTPEEWAAAAPTLLATASGGLAWRRVQGSILAGTTAALQCRDAYRLQTLDARIQEDRLGRALPLFESAGIRPILAKGWALARLYPAPGLRPYGDLDLHVAPQEFEAAGALVRAHESERLRVDLHRGVPRLARPWPQVAERSVQAPLGDIAVSILGPEDHLALLCGHLLFHGAWRPVWLCDVAMLLEEIPADFDWDYLMSLLPRQREEVRLVALLAHRLLGAQLDRTPWASDEPIPGWLPTATLRAWERGGHYSVTTRIALPQGGAKAFLTAARMRWPNPIEVTYRWRAPYNSVPRLPYQLLDAAVRAGRALVEAPAVVAGQLPSD